MDMAVDSVTDMATAVTFIPADTAGVYPRELMETNENGTLRSRSEIPAYAGALGNWRSRMKSAAQQQARELPELHRTVSHMANMLETPTALQEVQWRGMKWWLEEKRKCGTCITRMT